MPQDPYSSDERITQLLSDFFDNAAVGLHWQAQDGTVQRANHATLRLLGLREDEFVGRNIARFHADPQVARDIVERLARGEILDSYEACLRARDGSLRDVLLSANVLREGGRFVHARCFTRDITHYKQAQRALQEADRRKAAILNASLDAIVTMDAEGRLVDFNAAAEHIFGYPREQAIGRRLSELIIPPALRQAHEEGVRRYLQTGVGPVIGRRIEITALHADGHEFPVELSIAVVAGSPAMFTATLRDIGPRKQAEQELKATLQALQTSEAALREADRRKDEFIAMLAHELRNPLAPVRNAAELLSLPGLPPERLQWVADVVLRQVGHMARLLDDLLDAARVTRGTLVLRKQPVALAAVVHAAVEVARPLMQGKGQQLDLALAPEPLELQADPVRLAQVLSNLLTNAAKYSEPGDRIGLRAERRGAQVVIEVRDEGIGIDAQGVPQLFTLFGQLPAAAARAEGGLGVGLALSRSLVQLHGGTLQVHSAGEGKGSTFTVTLPLADAPA